MICVTDDFSEYTPCSVVRVQVSILEVRRSIYKESLSAMLSVTSFATHRI